MTEAVLLALGNDAETLAFWLGRVHAVAELAATDAPTPEDAPALARSRLASWLRDWHRSALGELGEAVSCPPTVLAILGDAAESVDWRVVAGRLLAYREGEGL